MRVKTSKGGRSISIRFDKPGEGLQFVRDFAEATRRSAAARSPGVLTNGAACACGSRLPWHLAELGLTRHICGCGVVYDVTEEAFTQKGSTP